MLALVLALVSGAPVPGAIPLVATPADALSTPQLHHHEVLRIDRDFGDSDFEIVVDAWERAGRSTLADVRFWWLRPSQDDARAPFSSKIRRYLHLAFERSEPDLWSVSFSGDRKQFAFEVELDENGTAAAYADVETAQGRIDHCRATHGHLVARRFIGIPVGIKRLEVRCTDDRGHTHFGELPYRKTRRGRLYHP